MTHREILKQMIRGGLSRQGRLSVFTVCKGVKTFESKQPIDCSIDIAIEVHCSDRKQLDLQT